MPSTTKPGHSGLRTQQIVEFAIWMTVAAGMWIYSYSFDRELSTYAFGPVAWPRAVILLIAAVAILSFLSDWRLANNKSVVRLDDEELAIEQPMDGAALFDEIRRFDPNVNLYVLSGFHKDEVVQTMLEKGAKGFLEKPVRFAKLEATVKTALSQGDSLS